MPIVERPVPVRAITSGKPHFYGYYDKQAWNASQRYHLAGQVEFEGRSPEPDDVMTVGLVDLRDNDRFIPLDTTTAWCWQQGCMLQWLGSDAERHVIYNVRVGDEFHARIADIDSGDTRDLPRSIYCVTPDGRMAGCANHARIGWTRPGYGYNGIADPNRDVLAPEDDGVWVMDLETGEAKLLISLAQLAANDLPPSPNGAHHWVNHLLFSRDGKRLEFLHRWGDEDGRQTRMYTCNPDGSDLHLFESDGMVSHFDWLGNEGIIAWAARKGEGNHFYFFHDRSEAVDTIGPDVMTNDGHLTFSPDRKWILNDTYPSDFPDEPHRCRGIYLFRRSDGTRFNLGRFMIDESVPSGELRCDLHPRWSRDGMSISFDSMHEGVRQIYTMDLREFFSENDA